MKMRRILLLVLLVVAVCVFWFYFHRSVERPPTVEPVAVETNPPIEAKENARPTQSSAPRSTAVSSTPTPESDPAAWIEHRRQQMEEERQRGLNEWQTPIEFYGKVVDENTNAVAGASVHFVWTDLSPKGTSEKDTASDQDGLFSLSNTNGKNLIVQVSKDGYYAYEPFGAAFNYAAENQNFVPDAANPVVFRLKKKGDTEPLVVFEKNFQISISGKPLEIDLSSGMAVSPGQGNAIMEFVKQPPEKLGDRRYDWTFRITVPGGGLLLSTNEFDFLAPERGYEPSALAEMKSSWGDDWQSRMKRQYFVRMADGRYARIVLDLMSHNGSLKVQAFSNPSGSRNLEFDPSNAIQSGR